MTVQWTGIFKHGLLRMPLDAIDLNDNLQRIYGKYHTEYVRYLKSHTDICPSEVFQVITQDPGLITSIDQKKQILEFHEVNGLGKRMKLQMSHINSKVGSKRIIGEVELAI